MFITFQLRYLSENPNNFSKNSSAVPSFTFFVSFCCWFFFFPTLFVEGQRNGIKKTAERRTSVAFHHTQSKATSLFRRTRGLFQGGAELKGDGWGRKPFDIYRLPSQMQKTKLVSPWKEKHTPVPASTSLHSTTVLKIIMLLCSFLLHVSCQGLSELPRNST